MDVREQAWELKQQGFSYAEIAEKLGIGKSTAHKYVKQWEEIKKREPSEPSEPEESEERGSFGEYDIERNAIPDEIKDYVESGETKLKVVGVQEVVKEINTKITKIEEPKVKAKAVEEESKPQSIKEKAVSTITGNKIGLLLIIISIAVILGVLYYFFRRQPAPEEVQEEAKQKVVEKRTNPQAESTYDWLERSGLKENVVVL
jgi:predicted DNA-binding protein YlxM (UPF0122 family)